MIDHRILISVAVAGAAFGAAMLWKKKYRKKVSEWLRDHHQKKYKQVIMRIIGPVDNLIKQVPVVIFAKTISGMETPIERTVVKGSVTRGLGMTDKNGIKRAEQVLFDEKELKELEELILSS